jgi:hypothetical protein
MAASNTKDCFRECVGKRIKGVVFNSSPINSRELSKGTKTLIFDDNTGLTITANGSFWNESVVDVESIIKNKKDELKKLETEICEVLSIAGVEEL